MTGVVVAVGHSSYWRDGCAGDGCADPTRELRWSEADAHRAAEALSVFAEPADVVELTGAAARSDAVVDAVTAHLGAGPTTVFVYVAAHADGEFLHLADGRVPVEPFRDALDRALRPGDLLVFVGDACRSGMWRGRGPADAVAIERSRRGWVELGLEGPAPEVDAVRGGLLTRVVLPALAGAADHDGDGAVSASELAATLGAFAAASDLDLRPVVRVPHGLPGYPLPRPARGRPEDPPGGGTWLVTADGVALGVVPEGRRVWVDGAVTWAPTDDALAVADTGLAWRGVHHAGVPAVVVAPTTRTGVWPDDRVVAGVAARVTGGPLGAAWIGGELGGDLPSDAPTRFVIGSVRVGVAGGLVSSGPVSLQLSAAAGLDGYRVLATGLPATVTGGPSLELGPLLRVRSAQRPWGAVLGAAAAPGWLLSERDDGRPGLVADLARAQVSLGVEWRP